MTTRRSKVLLAAVVAALAGCGGEAQPPVGGPQIEQVQQAVTWSPTQALVDQHVDWHTKPCSVNGQPLSGQVGVGRRCTNQGEDFLIWHRAFLKRLRDDFEAKGLTADITPWYSIPPEVHANGNWTA